MSSCRLVECDYFWDVIMIYDLPLYSLHAMQWDSVSVHSLWSSDKRLWAALRTGWFSQVSLESRTAVNPFRLELWSWLSMWASLWCGSWLDLLHFLYHYRREVLTVCLLKSDEFFGYFMFSFFLLSTHHPVSLQMYLQAISSLFELHDAEVFYLKLV